MAVETEYSVAEVAGFSTSGGGEGWGEDFQGDEPDDAALAEIEREDELLSEDGGYWEAVETDDMVRAYLSESGRVPLLTGEEEVDLAKRIEVGNEAKQVMDLLGIYEDGLGAKERMEDEEFDGDREELARKVEAAEVAFEKMPEEAQGQVNENYQGLVDRLDGQIEEGRLAFDGFVRANTRLVVSIAKKYMGRGVDFLDLIQEGNMGLMKAVRKYEWDRGHRFSTYATWWIRQGVTRAMDNQRRTIRIPVHLNPDIERMWWVFYGLKQELGRDPMKEEVALRMEMTPESIESLMEISRHPVSMQRPVGDNEDSEFGDFIYDKDSVSPEEAVEKSELHEKLEASLSALEKHYPREARILRLRSGLCEEGRDHTLEEVAREFGLTRERIRQLEGRGLQRLRSGSYGENLRDFAPKGKNLKKARFAG